MYTDNPISIATLNARGALVTVGKARYLARTLGFRVAAGYLRNRDIQIETALYWLTGRVTLEIAK